VPNDDQAGMPASATPVAAGVSLPVVGVGLGLARRISGGKTARDAQRCLKRAICRQLFKLLERGDHPRSRPSLEIFLKQLDLI
jgi:hypothetical protein